MERPRKQTTWIGPDDPDPGPKSFRRMVKARKKKGPTKIDNKSSSDLKDMFIDKRCREQKAS